MRRKWVWALAAAFAVLVLGLFLFEDGEYERVTVEARAIQPEVFARARVEAANGVSKVRCMVDGRLLEVRVQEGERVGEGQLVAIIDNPALEAERQRAEADLHAAEAELATIVEGMRPEERDALEAAERAIREEVVAARADWERASSLFEHGFVAKARLDAETMRLREAEARLDQARAEARLARAGGRDSDIAAAQERVKAARAALDYANEQFGHTRLVAPTAGTVVGRAGNPGDIVFPDALQTPILEIADLSALEVRIEVEQIDAAELMAGLHVRLLNTEDRADVGACTISRVSQRLRPRTIGAEDARLRAASQVRSLWCRVEAERISKPLLLDQQLEAVIALPAVDVAAAVPRTAIYVEEGRTLVLKRGRVDRVPTPVTLGVRDSEFVAVGDLEAGEEILVPLRR